MPQIELYDRRSYPKTHLAKYNKMMQVASVSDDAKCLCFSLTFTRNTVCPYDLRTFCVHARININPSLWVRSNSDWV
uniref:Uncharacterized protein n=1 Tax=Cannabis sativa TaxID=3483 RepID=A0A803QD84_CANSA